MPQNPYAWIEESLAAIHRANWYRSVQTTQGLCGAVIEMEGRALLNFASNDYLGLAGDERLIAAAVAATLAYGTGSTGSRLLSGHRDIHFELESAIAALKQTEDALVFSSGYLANLGVISAIVGKRDLILADQYNHSSLKNGALLSGATVIEYPHCDVDTVSSILEQQRDRYRRCLIITDSVFSMDGDLCPLPQLLNLASDFDCMLLVDEAHATGVLGKTGAGCVEHFNCTNQQIIQVGTLSKALGSLGGYVAGGAALIDLLRNRAPSWIYTTALSAADTAAAFAAIKIIHQEPERRQKLWHNVNHLKQRFTQLPHIQLLPSASSILCLQLATVKDALVIANQLKTSGIFAPAIRPPTVPTSRIRISLMATHELLHIERLIEVLSITKGHH